MMAGYKTDLDEGDVVSFACDQCGKRAVALLDGWPVCGRHWAQYRKSRPYVPDIDQGPVHLTGEDIARALTPPDTTRPVVSARTAIAALERSQGKK